MEISFNNESVFLDIDSLSFRNNLNAIDISAYVFNNGNHLLNIKSNSLNGECIIATDNFRLNSLAGEGYDGSYVQIDQYGNLKTSDSNLKIFDISFHRIYLRQEEISANQFINAKHMNDIDASYIDISNDFIQVKQMLDTFDSSVVKVNNNINLFDISMNTITISFEKIDESLNYIDNYIIDTSNSLNKLRNIDLSYILIDGQRYTFPSQVNNINDNNILVANHSTNSFEWQSYRILDGSQDLSLNNLFIDTTLNVTGQTELSNNVFIYGDVDTTGDLSLSGNISLTGGLNIIGDISHNGGTEIFGDISLIGDTYISKNLDVDYSISADTLVLRGTDVSITYIHEILADISGKQETFLDGIYNKNLTNINTDLNNLSSRIFDNEITLNGLTGIGAQNIQISGKRYIFYGTGPEYHTSNAAPGTAYKILKWNDSVQDNLRGFTWETYRVLDGSHDLSINHLDIYSGIDTEGELNVTGNTELSGNVNVYGITELSGNVIIHDGTIDISGDTSIIGNTDLSGNVHISQNLDISNNLSIDELTSTQNFKLNKVDMFGHVNLNGATNVIEYESASITNLEFKPPNNAGDISGAIITPNGTKIRFL